MGTRLPSSETPSISIRTSSSIGYAGFLSGGGERVRLVISFEKELVEVGNAEADRAPTDLQRDSRVADVMVGPLPPTNQEEQSTADRQ